MGRPLRRRAARDFPYYAGDPRRLSAEGWALVLCGCIAGYIGLMLVPDLMGRPLGRWVGVCLFVGLPLLTLRLAAGRDFTAFLSAPRLRDILVGVAFTPLSLIVSALVALVVVDATVTTGNAAAEALRGAAASQVLARMATTLPQLFGEELIALSPFLALLTLLTGPARLSRRQAIFAAWIGSSLIFGALHLSTYGWNAAQALGVIGAARLVLTMPYLVTKSPWSSFAAHLAHDWLLFAALALSAG